MRQWDGQGTVIPNGLGIGNYTIESLVNDGASITYIANDGSKKVFLKHFKDPNKFQSDYSEFITHQNNIDNKLKVIQKNSGDIHIEENHQLFEEHGYHFQAKKLVDNAESLDKVLSRTGSDKLTLPQRLLISRDLLKTLKVLHENNLIHSDLKQEQIILSADNSKDSGYKFTLIDFDHAVLVQSGTKIGAGAGTALWLSPEHVDNVDKEFASDIFTASLLINYVLSGYHPFQNAVENDNYDVAIKNYSCKKLSTRNKAFSKGQFKIIDDLLYKALDPKHQNRPTVIELLEAFEGLFKSASNPKALKLISGSNSMIFFKEEEFTRDMCKSNFNDIYEDIYKSQFKIMKDKSGKWLIMGTNTTTEAKNKKGEILKFYPTLLNDIDTTNRPMPINDKDTISIGPDVKFTIEFIK